LGHEDKERLEFLQKLLSKEEIVKRDFKNEFEKMAKDSQKLLDSKMPVQIKEKMMQGLR